MSEKNLGSDVTQTDKKQKWLTETNKQNTNIIHWKKLTNHKNNLLKQTNKPQK